MARGMHRHRRIRLDRLAATKLATRAAKRPGKVKARARRDTRLIALAKTQLAKTGSSLSGEVQSWLSRQTGKPFSRLTPAEISAALS